MIIDEAFVIKTDDELVANDVKLHQRPFHVALAWMQSQGIAGNIFDKAIWDPLMEIYRKLYPSGDFTMPGLFEGGVAIRDRMYGVRIDVSYGTCAIDPIKLIDIQHSELELIFKNYPDQGWRALYGAADLFDLAYGVADLEKDGGNVGTLLNNARSQAVATARTLMADIDIDAAVQSACLTAELAMKGALAKRGWPEKKYKESGHHVDKLAAALIGEVPNAYDARLQAACSKFPKYAQSRYTSHGMKRIEVMDLAMRAQFVAAEAVRRVTTRGLAIMVETTLGNPPRPGL